MPSFSTICKFHGMSEGIRYDIMLDIKFLWVENYKNIQAFPGR